MHPGGILYAQNVWNAACNSLSCWYNCNSIVQAQIVPIQFRQIDTILPMPEVKKHPSLQDNYKGITLSHVLTNMYGK